MAWRIGVLGRYQGWEKPLASVYGSFWGFDRLDVNKHGANKGVSLSVYVDLPYQSRTTYQTLFKGMDVRGPGSKQPRCHSRCTFQGYPGGELMLATTKAGGNDDKSAMQIWHENARTLWHPRGPRDEDQSCLRPYVACVRHWASRMEQTVAMAGKQNQQGSLCLV